MKKVGLLALACVLGMSACTHPREATDAQLATLLRAERANAGDANARLDPASIECLRVFSGQADLMNAVGGTTNTEQGKKTCRTNLDAWLADAKRNPDTLTFAEVTTPASVRRAIALYMARASTSAGAPPPAVLTTAPVTPRPSNGPPIDLGSAGVALKAVEDLCQQTQQTAAAQPTNVRAKRYADYCGRRLIQMRSAMETAVKNHDMDQLDKLVQNAQRLGEIGKESMQPAAPAAQK
jgi:hypothetical protein